MAKALEQYQIYEIYKLSLEGKTHGELAAIYHVSPATIKQYLMVERARREPQPQDKQEGYNIKVISTTPGKTLNFREVTEIKKDKDWIKIYRDGEVIGLLVPENVTAILPLEG